MHNSTDRRPRKVRGTELFLHQAEGGRYFSGAAATPHGLVSVAVGRPLYGEGWARLEFIFRRKIYARRFGAPLSVRAAAVQARKFAREVAHARH